VNAPIARLFAVSVVLFAVLVVFTSKWTVFGAESLQKNPKNRRELLEAQKVDRGPIRAGDGTVLARSVRRSDGTFSRRYPQGGLFAHAVGYSYTRLGRAGLESSYDDELTGRRDALGTVFERLVGTDRRGDGVTTTLDPAAQRVALQQLGGRKGSVVALDPRTGAVKVLANEPAYDPNALRDAARFEALNRDPNAPLLDRATQAGYPPGSTFKVVTTAAAIDSGRYTPNSIISGRSPKIISGTPLSNFGGEQFGPITLTTALTNSVNTVFATVGENLGKATMARYMDRFGFGDQVAIDLPGSERAASGERVNGRIVSPTSPAVDVGRLAIGQDKLTVTPLQMAMVAAAVANGGKLMRPHLADKVIDRDGRTVRTIGARTLSTVMRQRTALEVGDMMANVVREGSGTAAALQGIDVAGKTGTAEVDRSCGPNQLWFIAFAPVRDPKVAIATTIECGTGTGGTVAAPVAKAVMQELLR
jgi:penicillin-binding protein A